MKVVLRRGVPQVQTGFMTTTSESHLAGTLAGRLTGAGMNDVFLGVVHLKRIRDLQHILNPGLG